MLESSVSEFTGLISLCAVAPSDGNTRCLSLMILLEKRVSGLNVLTPSLPSCQASSACQPRAPKSHPRSDDGETRTPEKPDNIILTGDQKRFRMEGKCETKFGTTILRREHYKEVQWHHARLTRPVEVGVTPDQRDSTRDTKDDCKTQNLANNLADSTMKRCCFWMGLEKTPKDPTSWSFMKTKQRGLLLLYFTGPGLQSFLSQSKSKTHLSPSGTMFSLLYCLLPLANVAAAIGAEIFLPSDNDEQSGARDIVPPDAPLPFLQCGWRGFSMVFVLDSNSDGAYSNF